jgi:hypothetical protein
VPSSQKLTDVLRRLANAEERFLAGTFLAPALRGGQVQVRIAGVNCQLKTRPAEFAGWGVFRPLSHKEAQLQRAATLAERQRYLELFPLVRLILCRRADDGWLAIPAHQADRRLRTEGTLPVHFVEDGQLFEVVQCRFDGSHWWFECLDARRDPGAAAYLRQALQEMVEPRHLSRPGLTAEEKAAYALNYWPALQAELEARRDRTADRLRAALAHAGAELRDYLDRGDVYRVTYEVDGREHVSVIGKDDLSVQVAGICLSGEDQSFDLQSLVGVIREGHASDGLVRVGD